MAGKGFLPPSASSAIGEPQTKAAVRCFCAAREDAVSTFGAKVQAACGAHPHPHPELPAETRDGFREAALAAAWTPPDTLPRGEGEPRCRRTWRPQGATWMISSHTRLPELLPDASPSERRVTQKATQMHLWKPVKFIHAEWPPLGGAVPW